jgi:hypothetical protein
MSQGETAPAPARFWLALGGIALVALALRIAYGHAAHLPTGFGDDIWFHAVANGLADGRGFTRPFESEVGGQVVFGLQGHAIPTAFHLPLFPTLLAVGSKLGLTSYDAHQAIGCAFGAATVVLLGLIGRRLGGDRLALLAALIGALYAALVANDSVTMAESLYGALIAFVILAALRVHARPTPGRLVALGAGIALAALTRGEGLLLLPLLAAPLVWRAAGEQRMRALAIVTLATVVVMAPWCIRNSVTFHRPMLASTVSGSVVAGANSPSTYSGDLIGTWDFRSLARTETGRRGWLSEADQSDAWNRESREFALDHAGRLPAVAAVRLLRTFDLYPIDPVAQVRFHADSSGRLRSVDWLAMASFFVLAALAVAGCVALRRRGSPVWPFAAMLMLACVTSLLAYGDPRFRQAADVALVVPAAIGLETLLQRMRFLRGRSVRAHA